MDKSYGKIAYEAYCASTGNKSLVSGDNLPTWEEQSEAIRAAWEASSAAIVKAYEGDNPPKH